MKSAVPQVNFVIDYITKNLYTNWIHSTERSFKSMNFPSILLFFCADFAIPTKKSSI